MDDAARNNSDTIWTGKRDTGQAVPLDRGGAAYAASGDRNHPVTTTLYGREGTEARSVTGARASVTVTDRLTKTSAASLYGPTATFSNYDRSWSGAMGSQCHTTAGQEGASSRAFGWQQAQAVAIAQGGGCATAAVATHSGGKAIASGTNATAFSWKASPAMPSLWDRLVGLYNSLCQRIYGTPPIESAGTTYPITRQADN